MPGTDIAMLASRPRTSPGGWGVAARVLSRRRGSHPLVEHWQGTTVTVTAQRPPQAQLDGDPVGKARVLRMRADQGALLVRVRPTAERSTGATAR
ncbi:MAG: hypothetical protein ABR608_10300 [Pseudonocardiaceae bacterium]